MSLNEKIHLSFIFLLSWKKTKQNKTKTKTNKQTKKTYNAIKIAFASAQLRAEIKPIYYYIYPDFAAQNGSTLKFRVCG